MHKIRNNQGFTLVELLAVIVVLAIVMLIAVQAILPRMEEARRSVFALEANEAINAATTYWTNQSLKGSGGFPITDKDFKCVSLKTLVEEGYYKVNLADKNGQNGYEGAVQVTKSGKLYLYKVWIQKNSTMMVNGKGTTDDGKNRDINAETDVEEYSSTSFDPCKESTTS